MDLEKILFRDWRYENNDETKPKPDFVLNNPEYNGQILVAGKNFGCGSSAANMLPGLLLDYGFKCSGIQLFRRHFQEQCIEQWRASGAGKR